MRHIYEPRSQAEGTYRIIREQDKFHRGVWNDGSAKKAHPSGLYYSVNAIPYTDRVEIRSGSRIWSTKLPYVVENVEIIGRINGPKSGAINSGYQLSSNDIGRYVRWFDGQHYQIKDVHVWQFNTFSTLQEMPTGTIETAKVRGIIGALMYHRQLKWWVLHIDTRIYRARYDMTEWEEIPTCGVSPNEARGEMKTLGKDVLLFNSAGIFRISLGPHPICYKCNELCPSAWLLTTEGSTNPTYRSRRYLLSYSRMPSAGFALDRTSPGIVVEQQSGTNTPQNNNGTFVDWTEHRSQNPITPETPNYLIPPYAAPARTAFTHYTLWGTLDTGPAGTDPLTGSGNNPEQYWWIQDIPILRCAVIIDVKDNVITVDTPLFHPGDSQYRIGLGALETMTFISSTKIQVNNAIPEIIGEICSVTSSKAAVVSQSGKTITHVGLDAWTQDDIGKLVALSSGEFDWIQSVAEDGQSIKVTKSRELLTAGLVWDSIPFSPIQITDGLSDDDLKLRDGFMLTQRWLTNMPSCNNGVVMPGFVAGIQSGGEKLYYCQRENDSLIGYHHPGWQVQTCDEPLIVLSDFPHALVGYSRNGFCLWDLSAVQIINRNDSLESKTIPLGLTPLAVLLTRKFTTGHGVLDRGAVQKLPDGSDMVVTYSREYRIFNGHDWSRNLVADRIMNRLRKLGPVSAVHYNEESGFIHWSTDRGDT